MRFGLILAVVLAWSAPVYAAGDAAAGEKSFKRCKACHRIGDGAKNATGPLLTGVIGRPAGSVARFKYGASMVQAGEAGLVWTEESVANYIANPKAFLREYLSDPKAKARMTFKLKDAQAREDVAAYLATFSP